MPVFPEQFVTLRTCYRHPAGRVGVALTAALEERGWVERFELRGSALGGYRLTEAGRLALTELGVDLDDVTPASTHKACPDYTQRLPGGTRGIPHIGGDLGAALTSWLVSAGWAERLPAPGSVYETRTLVLTPAGREHLSAAGLIDRSGLVAAAASAT